MKCRLFLLALLTRDPWAAFLNVGHSIQNIAALPATPRGQAQVKRTTIGRQWLKPAVRAGALPLSPRPQLLDRLLGNLVPELRLARLVLDVELRSPHGRNPNGAQAKLVDHPPALSL